MGHCFGGSLGIDFPSQHLFAVCSLVTPHKFEPKSLGTSKFFDGMANADTLRKVYAPLI